MSCGGCGGVNRQRQQRRFFGGPLKYSLRLYFNGGNADSSYECCLQAKILASMDTGLPETGNCISWNGGLSAVESKYDEPTPGHLG